MQVNIIYDLHAMCLQGDLELIKIRILPRNINLPDKHGRTPLICAIRGHHLEVANYLLSQNADPNLRDQQGWSALMWASYQGQSAMVELLVQFKAATCLRNKQGMTALQLAQLKGHREIAQRLNKNKSFHISDQMQSWMYYLLGPRNTKNQ